MRQWTPGIIWGILIILIQLSLVFPQNRQPVYTINHIRIEGNVEADSVLIVTNSALRPGKELTADVVQRAIENLWNLHIFSDIQIFAENQTATSVDLVIKVKEYPRVINWTVVGNKKLKKKDVTKAFGFYRGMVYAPFKIYKGRKNLLKKYEEEGYLLAKVEVDTNHVSPQRVSVIVRIDEGEKVQVKRIRIFGNKYLKEKELKKAFKKIKEKRWWRGADFSREKYEEDKENLIKYCQKKGFRDAEIVRDSVYYGENKRDLFIDIYIKEGHRYYFGDVTFNGNTVFSDEYLKSQLLFKKGDVYNQEDFEKSIRENLQNLYYNRGYLFANIQPREIPVGNDTVDIEINIHEGDVVRVKEIIITGNTKTNEKVIRRELRIFPGDVFNRDKLERSVREVWILNYFANVVPDVKLIPNDDKHVNLEFKVEEKSTDQANMSAGYSQRDGFIGNLGLALNNFSLKHPLSGGDGQRLSIDWYFGKYYQSFSFSFTEPWMFNTPTLFGFSIFNTRYRGAAFRPWDQQDRGIALQFGRRLNWPDNFFRGDWIVRVAQTRVFNVRDPELLERYLFFAANTNQRSITQIITRDSRDRPEFPTMGSVFSLSTKMAGGPFGGNEDFFKTILNVKWFSPLKFGFVLYVNSQLGSIAGLKSGYYVSPGELFYMGGSGLSLSESLRGYDDYTVGPVTSRGNPLGGKALAKFTTEIRFLVSPNPTVYALVFMEGGNVWESFGEANLLDLKRSLGIGFRFFMPMVGMIGVDFGYGFDHLDPYQVNRKGQWKVHFKFGRP